MRYIEKFKALQNKHFTVKVKNGLLELSESTMQNYNYWIEEVLEDYIIFKNPGETKWVHISRVILIEKG